MARVGDAMLHEAKKLRTVSTQADEYWARLAEVAITKYEARTMRNYYDDVYQFHQKFDLTRPARSTLPPGDLFEFRLKFLHEELAELAHAYDERDLPGYVDALVDLVYVAIGTAVVSGVPFDAVWRAVHEANMKKVRAKSAEDSKRGSTYDVVKPPGWEPPDVGAIIRRHAGDPVD
jgi:predicted HAD superfamily Cof-like phosphohydrolase